MCVRYPDEAGTDTPGGTFRQKPTDDTKKSMQTKETTRTDVRCYSAVTENADLNTESGQSAYPVIGMKKIIIMCMFNFWRWLTEVHGGLDSVRPQQGHFPDLHGTEQIVLVVIPSSTGSSPST